jgi:hypothetical protein
LKTDVRANSLISKLSATPAMAATPAKPNVRSGLSQEQKPTRPLLREERRRTQRVLLRTRVQIHVALEGKLTTIDAITLSVNPQGALVVMKQNLPVETRLVLEHQSTKVRVPCRVPRLGREMPEGIHIPIEFDAPAPDFWGIVFPPVDWRADEE